MNVRARSSLDLSELRVPGAVLLAAAAALPLLPGPDGLPCPLRSLTGVPCPLCGMTTSVTAAVHFDPLQAIAANPAGVVAVLVVVGVLLSRRRLEVTFPVWLVPAALVLMEVWQLARFGFL